MLGGPRERSGFPPPSGSFTPPLCGLVLLRRSQRPASCLLPFAIPDRWLEIREEWQTPTTAIDNSAGPVIDYPNDGWVNSDFWDPDDEYDVVTQSGQHGGVSLLPEIVDIFDPTPMTGTGYGMANDNGLRVLLKANNTSVAAPSYYYPIVLPDGLGTGATTIVTVSTPVPSSPAQSRSATHSSANPETWWGQPPTS